MVNGSLKQVLRRKDRTIDRRKRLIIAMDAAFGMEYLHEKNIVHFDLKSENFLVNVRDPQRPVCKIGDLGLLKIKQKSLVSGGVRGTLPWIAPELLTSNNIVTEKVDVYSFGIVMWELLTREQPYADLHSEEILVILAHWLNNGSGLENEGDIGAISGENESIQKLANSIRKEIKIVFPFSYETCIYRVLENLHRLSESAYTPQLVSIGPFHHDNKSLRKMDEHKRWYLQIYLDWYPEIKLESCLEGLRELEGSARQCYVEHISVNIPFVEMMLLDGLFIIVLLIKFYSPEGPSNDPILDKMWKTCALDMILLENQLPFFVLEYLFNLVPVSNRYYPYPDLFDLIIHFFSNFVKMKTTPGTIDRSEVKHILDLLRSCCLPFPLSAADSPQDDRTPKVRHSVTELHEPGVQFKAGVSESSCLLDLKFVGTRVVEIQPLRIENGTESFFQNLIALEHCHYSTTAYVTCFVVFMDRLINTHKDVDLLIRQGIIENCLGNHDEVLRFINNISKDFFIGGLYFSRDYAELHEYYKKQNFRRWRSSYKWMISLRRGYLYSPWAIISVIAAILLLILTLIQTVCSLISL